LVRLCAVFTLDDCDGIHDLKAPPGNQLEEGPQRATRRLRRLES
jgi:hypothetical protein